MSELKRQLWEGAKRVDWPRVLQRAGAFVRAMRGEAPAAIEQDNAAELARAQKLQRTFQDLARAAVGCQRSPQCSCPICTEGTR